MKKTIARLVVRGDGGMPTPGGQHLFFGIVLPGGAEHLKPGQVYDIQVRDGFSLAMESMLDSEAPNEPTITHVGESSVPFKRTDPQKTDYRHPMCWCNDIGRIITNKCSLMTVREYNHHCKANIRSDEDD